MKYPRFTSASDEVMMDLKAAAVEFVGTVTFLLLALGGVQAGAAASGGEGGIIFVMYASMSMGLSLLVSAWLFYRVTGGLFNPNVSLALWLTGIIGPVRLIAYIIAQLLGGIAAAGIIRGLTSAPLASNTILSPQTSHAQGVFIEMFITAALVLAVLMLGAEKHDATPFAPVGTFIGHSNHTYLYLLEVGVGLTLFAGHLFAVYYTGAAMNTARAFGPAVVSGFPYGGHWVYWVGPSLGSLLGAGLFTIFIHYQYWLLNPGQDTVDPAASPDDPLLNAKAAVTGQSITRNETHGLGPRNSLRQSQSPEPRAASNVSSSGTKWGGDVSQRGEKAMNDSPA
ncbi:hypothetical protein ONZ45_g12013 [Pleurotus djamor]|nr:hypothetical protein ONZ45_g12013 [Pleurotus djamor]